MKLKSPAQKKLIQTPHIVAFLDFLGASEKMRDPAKNDSFLQAINAVYARAKYILEKTEVNRNNKLKIKIFSDNIVIAQEIENPEDPKNVFSTYLDVEQFSLMLYSAAMLTGNLMRGAISIGKLYIDETLVYGQALLDAHNGESQIANYPRIIVDKDIFVYANTNIWDSFSQPDEAKLVRRDIDGVLFLNPFWGVSKMAENNRIKAQKLLEHIRNFILKEYKNLFDKNRKNVMPKYSWLANQFNLYVSENEYDLLLNLDKIVAGGEA